MLCGYFLNITHRNEKNIGLKSQYTNITVEVLSTFENNEIFKHVKH